MFIQFHLYVKLCCNLSIRSNTQIVLWFKKQLFFVCLGMNETTFRKFELKNVEYLLGCTAKLKEIIVLGMITQLKEVA